MFQMLCNGGDSGQPSAYYIADTMCPFVIHDYMVYTDKLNPCMMHYIMNGNANAQRDGRAK